MTWWFGVALWKRVLGALVLGLIFGAILSQILGGEAAASFIESYIKPVGDLFIRLIRMLIVPLILTTLVAGVVALGDPKKLGSIGVKTIALYFVTTLFANTIGIIFGLVFRPGAGSIWAARTLFRSAPKRRPSPSGCWASCRRTRSPRWPTATFWRSSSLRSCSASGS